MRIVALAAFVALATKGSSAFTPNAKVNSVKSTTELNVISHYSRVKPPTHPDYKTNMNNFELDEFSGMPFAQAEELREENRLRAQLLAEELHREEEAEYMARIEAEEEARRVAAEERARIREADEARMRALEEAREESRRKAAEEFARLKAEEEERYRAMELAQEQAEEEYREMSDEEKTSEMMKSSLSDEDRMKMVGLRGWRRMQFMDNTLDGNIIKRFPRKHPDHPDSRTNNKHIDLNEYVEVSVEEYEAMREEARLEARRLNGEGARLDAAARAAQSDSRMAAVQRGKALRETGYKVYEQEANNRIVMRRY